MPNPIPYLKPGETLMSRLDIANAVIREFNRWQKCEGLNNLQVEHSEDSITIRRLGDTACTVRTHFEDDFEDENGGTPVTPWGDWANWYGIAGGPEPDLSVIPTSLETGDSGLCLCLGRAENDFNFLNSVMLRPTAMTDVKRGNYTLSFRYAPGPDILEQTGGVDYVDCSLGDYRYDGTFTYFAQTDGTFPISDAQYPSNYLGRVYAGDAWKSYSLDFRIEADLPYLALGIITLNTLPNTDPTYPHYKLLLIDDVRIINRCPFN